MYQSIPSLTIPRATPGDFHFPTARGWGFRSTLFERGGGGGWGFELEKFSTVLNEKKAGTSRFVSKNRRQLESRCSCAVSYQFLQKL